VNSPVITGVIGTVYLGTEIEGIHTWDIPGIYDVLLIAKDAYDESDWSLTHHI
jgi:hypothetical protein